MLQDLWSPQASLAVYSTMHTLMIASHEPVQAQCPHLSCDDEIGYPLISTKTASYLKPSVQMVEDDMSRELTTKN